MDDGWTDLQKMWDTKQSLFTQSNKLLVSALLAILPMNVLLCHRSDQFLIVVTYRWTTDVALS